jgi:tyrosine-protein phosphatase SIW14
MKISRRTSLFLFSFLFSSLLCAQQVENTAPATKVSPVFAEKIGINGVSNAGKVNHYLYRGSQPDEQGLQELKKLGVTTIVDLRGELHKKKEWEMQEAKALGMLFILIPGNGWSPPTDEQIAQFFALLTERPRQTIFIHCWFGTDRTGVFIAAYRLAFDHWTPEQAIAEMYAFHFKGFWHPAMKQYIRTFPARLANSPLLAPYRITQRAESPGQPLTQRPTQYLRTTANVTPASFSCRRQSLILLHEAS